jgi:hypothetical protein
MKKEPTLFDRLSKEHQDKLTDPECPYLNLQSNARNALQTTFHIGHVTMDQANDMMHVCGDIDLNFFYSLFND